MPSYTKINLEQIPDVAPEYGLPQTSEMHLATAALGTEQIGLTLWRVAPGQKLGFGHRHETSEELYPVFSGSGRFRAGDDVFEIGPRDVVAVGPQTMREYEAGPDGLELIAFGAHHEGEKTEAADRGWWTD